MDDIMRKLCENEDTDQLNREADQRLCFRYRYSTFRLLSKSEILTPNCPLWLNGTVCVGPCQKPQCLFSRVQVHIYFKVRIPRKKQL